MSTPAIELSSRALVAPSHGENLLPGKFSSFNVRANRRVYQKLVAQHELDALYIKALEDVLREHNIELPSTASEINLLGAERAKNEEEEDILMKDGSISALHKVLEKVKDYHNTLEVHVHFKNLSFWRMAPEAQIPTVGSTLKNMFLGSGPKQRINVLKDLTGRILRGKMTLIVGPPGCGKSSFLKALSGKLNLGSMHLDGTVTYNGDTAGSGKFLLPKIADYIDEKEQHAATLTVQETMEFAWAATSNNHHAYGVTRTEEGEAALGALDEVKAKVHNIMKILGIDGVANTVVGDGMLRGVSGGQKRRVTVGEMMVPPRVLKFMDAVSNGLDASTTYDIFRSLRYAVDSLRVTIVVSLLQPAPEVFNLFDELILMSEGQIIFQGPTNKVLDYFKGIGYQCPATVDLADFLQVLPTDEGKYFASDENVPIGTAALVETYQKSSYYKSMIDEMAEIEVKMANFEWPDFTKEPYAMSMWDSIVLCLGRQVKLTVRDLAFIKGRVIQTVVIGAITGSLFNNLDVEDTNSMNGMLFFSVLFVALSSMSMLPLIFAQREVFYKHARANFFPTIAFTIAQTSVLIPLQIVEAIVFSTIVYWSVGMSDDNNGARFLTFIVIVLGFGLTMTQMFRLIASFMPSAVVAQPFAGTITVLTVLFSGFIVPKSGIPPGWIWFYWINPLSWALKSVTVNEYLSKEYDFDICTNADCSKQSRFGDVVLESRGNPTEQGWVWYGIAYVYAAFAVFVLLTSMALSYVRVEAIPPPPIKVDESEEKAVTDGTPDPHDVHIPYDPVTFSFKNLWYTVTLKSGEELDLLRGVSGFFEPGTLTALMGSSGAGKTTLLDVLAGRKNTGVIKGDICVNGRPKNNDTFRHMMGYVEQFDSLSPRDTAREAIEFSAGLRLPRDTPPAMVAAWVDSVLDMLELTSLQNTLVGDHNSGGMSFEQKKRLSIAVELVANPAILFLDEPTSGLDSRAAQVVIRCIRRVAAGGRCIVCTIHQPSYSIFTSFDSLLLLRRGGQTVFNGELGDNCERLISYFQSAPGVSPIKQHQNPATWMLEVIGAGTSASSSVTSVDFHNFYKQSILCAQNTSKVDILCSDPEGSDDDHTAVADTHCKFVPVFICSDKVSPDTHHTSAFTATYATQFKYVLQRALRSYWRSPSYNFVRMLTCIIIALIFASTYADQNYNNDVETMSRCAVMYITLLFCGVVAMMSVQPVMFGERPAFYREQYSQLYDVKIYTLSTGLVEVPYLLVSSVLFTVPFFFIVGFDQDGVTSKFMWYWVYQTLYMSVLVFIGQFFSAATPNEAASQVVTGMVSTILSLFCGYMIPSQNIPTFWVFLYWLNPLHYALEGLFTTQFKDDNTDITLITGGTTTAEAYVKDAFSEWSYSHRYGDAVALVIFIIVLRLGTYLCLRYIRHDKR